MTFNDIKYNEHFVLDWKLQNFKKRDDSKFLLKKKASIVLYWMNEERFNEDEDEAPRNHLSRSLYFKIGKNQSSITLPRIAQESCRERIGRAADFATRFNPVADR